MFSRKTLQRLSHETAFSGHQSRPSKQVHKGSVVVPVDGLDGGFQELDVPYPDMSAMGRRYLFAKHIRFLFPIVLIKLQNVLILNLINSFFFFLFQSLKSLISPPFMKQSFFFSNFLIKTKSDHYWKNLENIIEVEFDKKVRDAQIFYERRVEGSGALLKSERKITKNIGFVSPKPSKIVFLGLVCEFIFFSIFSQSLYH